MVKVFAKIKELDLPLGEYVVTGGAMAAHGIREAHDLDIIVTPKLYQQLLERGYKACDCEQCLRTGRIMLKAENIETIDGLPYIGSYSKNNVNMLIATGFSGNGMTYAAVAGQIFTDIVLKRNNPYIELYDASRKTKLHNFMKKLFDFVGEFFGGAAKNIFRS